MNSRRILTALTDRYRGITVLVLLLVLGFLLYGRILHAPFIFDDNKMILENWKIRSLDNVKRIWQAIDYPRLCFLTFVSFAVNYHFGGYDPFGYHLVNLLLHIGSTFLLFLFICEVFQGPFMRRQEFGYSGFEFALFSALIFLVHPIQTQAVTYIWSRTELLSAFGGLISLNLYIAGRNRKNVLCVLLSVLFFVAAVFARGNMVIWPVLIVLIEVSFYDLNFRKIQSLFRTRRLLTGIVIGVGSIALLFFVRQIASLNLGWFLTEPIDSRWDYLLTQFRVIVTYIRLSFIPYPQNLDYYFVPSRSFFEPKTLLSFLAIVITLALSARIFARRRMLAFGVLWYFFALIPVSTILVLSVYISESRLYFPLAGFSIFLTALIFRSLPHPRRRNALLVGMIAIFAVLTVMRNELWRSPVAIWEDALRQAPQHPRPRTVLGMLYARQGRLQEAAELLEQSRKWTPEFLGVQNNLGAIYMRMGRFEEAEKIFRRIIEYDPSYLYAYLNLAQLKLSQRDFWSTRDLLEKSMRLCGLHDEAFLILANSALIRRKDKPKQMDRLAFNYLDKVIQLNPRSRGGYSKLVWLHMQRGEYTQALETVRQWIRVRPEDYEAFIRLGAVSEALQDHSAAVRAYEQAIALDPRNPTAYGALGKFYFSLKQYDLAQKYYEENFRRGRLQRRSGKEASRPLSGAPFE